MNKLSTSERASVIAALVEGNSINSTARMTGISKPTILKLLAKLGTACQVFHDKCVRNLISKRVQCDEIWAFCYCKKMNTPTDLKGVLGYGDVWTWTGIDADTKLMIQWTVGLRDASYARQFMRGMAPRFANRIQITTDGYHPYKNAIGNWLDVEKGSDYAQCIKLYGDEMGAGKYSPGECTGVEVRVCWGNPDPAHISTSFVERSNLTMRMGIRRYTRLTNGFSKKIENHEHMTAIFFTYYNFCRVHMTTGLTPAVASGIASKKWTVQDLVNLMA